jgi:hypothetical protein
VWPRPCLLSFSQTSTHETTAAASEVTTAASRPARRHLSRVECRPSSRVAAPSSAGLDRAVAVSVVGEVVVRQPAAVPKPEAWQMTLSSRVSRWPTGGEKWINDNDDTRKKGSPDRALDRLSQSLVVARSSSSLGFGRSQRTARWSRRRVEPKEMRAQAREVRINQERDPSCGGPCSAGPSRTREGPSAKR